MTVSSVSSPFPATPLPVISPVVEPVSDPLSSSPSVAPLEMLQSAGPVQKQAELAMLQKNIDAVSKFLPVDFSGLETTLSELDLLFNTIAFSFAFDPDVKEVIRKEKGERFEYYAPPLKGDTILKCARACNALLEALLPKLGKIHEGALTVFWRALVDTQKWASELKEFTPAEIGKWLKDPANDRQIRSVYILRFGKSPLQILPPEVNRLKNLIKIGLEETQILDFPHILNNHPNFSRLKIEVDDGKFVLFSGI